MLGSSTRGNQRVDQRKPRGIDQERGRFAQHRERLGADGRRPDRMLDDPIRVVNRRTDERRPGGEPERIDNDAARQRSRMARAPDGIDLAVDFRDQQHRGQDDESGAKPLELSRLGRELRQVLTHDRAAPGKEVTEQERFQCRLRAFEHREPRHVREGNGEQRHEPEQRRIRKARRSPGEPDTGQTAHQTAQEGDEGQESREHEPTAGRRLASGRTVDYRIARARLKHEAHKAGRVCPVQAAVNRSPGARLRPCTLRANRVMLGSRRTS